MSGWARRFRDRVTSSPAPYPDGTFEACGRRQTELSHRVTTLIDVLYGLVLVTGAESYHRIFTDGRYLHPDQGLPVWIAVVFVYFTTVQSFVDFHLSEEDRPYLLLDEGNRGVDLRRFYLDIVIVGFYSFLLLRCHVLLESAGGDLTAVFIALPAIFALYLLWGRFRDGSATRHYSPRLLKAMLAIYGVLAVAYPLFDPSWVINAAFLAAALVLMVGYRWLNWAQNRVCP